MGLYACLSLSQDFQCLHLTTTHLTGMLYFLTAVPVFELEEIFLELHTCFLVSSYLVNPRNSSFVSERLPREN